MTNWRAALAAFAEAVRPFDLIWMLVGSAATRLRGTAGISPGDVDILVHPDTKDATLLHLARDLTAAHPMSAPSGQTLDTFTSTPDHPLLDLEPWLFGRWHVDGAKLEVARITAHLDSGIAETHGRKAWQHRQWVNWEGLRIPVIPLEVQWATNTLRGQKDRLAAIAAMPQTSWNEGLAREALLGLGLDPEEHASSPTTVT